MFAIIAIIITSAAIALGSLSAGGGGGGGSGSSSSSGGSSSSGSGGGSIDAAWIVSEAEANIYRTTEYNSQQGLEKIHAAEAYAALAKNNKSVAGEGVKIAVIDSGAQEDHVDLAANISVADGHNYNQNSNDVADTLGLGTYAASLAAGVKNDDGVHGVAYDANLVISDIYNDAGDSLVADSGISGSAAIEDVGVMNIGWKYGSYTTYSGTPSGTNSADRAVIVALKVAQANDILVVAAAGDDADNANDGGGDAAYLNRLKPQKPALFANNSELEGYVLSVIAVDQNSQIIDSSNICGITHEYCLAAVGSNILGASSDTNSNGGVGDVGAKYATISSSNAAAAQVSGAAAVLRAAWPFLTAPQVANILLTTATDLGDAGDDTIYGYGLLNLYAAVQAQGSNNFSYGTSLSQNSYDVRASSIIVDPIFGDAFANNVAPVLQKAVFFDDYGRDYKAFLDGKIMARGKSWAASGLGSNEANNYKTNIVPLLFGAKNSSDSTQIKLQIKSYSDLGAKFANIDKSQQDRFLTAGNGFSLKQNFLQKSQFGFASNVDEIKNLSFEKLNNFGFVSVNGFAANPYQSFVANPYQTAESTKNFNQIFVQQKFFDDKLKFNFSHQTSYQNSSILAKSGNVQNQISDFNFNYLPNDSTNLSLSFGRLSEFNNNFLNSQALGAFESGGNAKTSYFKIAASKKIYKNLSLITNFSQGFTEVSGNNFGIFRDYRDIKSRGAALGLVTENVLGGRLGVLYSEPLRVYSGKATINIAVARDKDGNVIRYVEDVSLKPQGKEQDFEVFYAKDLTQLSQISANFLVIKDLGNFKSDRNVYFGTISYGMKF